MAKVNMTKKVNSIVSRTEKDFAKVESMTDEQLELYVSAANAEIKKTKRNEIISSVLLGNWIKDSEHEILLNEPSEELTSKKIVLVSKQFETKRVDKNGDIIIETRWCDEDRVRAKSVFDKDNTFEVSTEKLDSLKLSLGKFQTRKVHSTSAIKNLREVRVQAKEALNIRMQKTLVSNGVKPMDVTAFGRELFKQMNVKVLPVIPVTN